jgi:hypothetical protein
MGSHLNEIVSSLFSCLPLLMVISFPEFSSLSSRNVGEISSLGCDPYLRAAKLIGPQRIYLRLASSPELVPRNSDIAVLSLRSNISCRKLSCLLR